MARIAIVGCGAMGSVYAGLMADAGHEVFGVTLWADHAQVMERHGLRVEGASGDRIARVHGRVSTDGIGVCDLVIIATKAFDVQSAAQASLPLLGPETPVQTIQNGLGSADLVAPIVGADRLVVGVVGGFGASLRAPGHAHHNGMEMIRFGAYAGLPRKRLEASARIWEQSGFKVLLFEDITRMIWEKLIMNVTFSGTSCLTGMTIGEVMAEPNAWHVARGCAEEAVAVAGALGIKLEVGDPIQHIRALGGKIPNARPSMLLDHLARQRSEIDFINGSIPRLGAQAGLATPVNQTVVALVKARETGFGPG
ncbi:MAG: 2-dehydropantoate 2-reductase [Acetobacteraceae bacterium]|nr:2-dehydropantoate 2-reductase [Acetobacteraceae bacterium]